MPAAPLWLGARAGGQGRAAAAKPRRSTGILPILIAGVGLAALAGIGVVAVSLVSVGTGPPVAPLADTGTEGAPVDGVASLTEGSAAVGEPRLEESARADREEVPATEPVTALAAAHSRPAETMSHQADNQSLSERRATAITNGSAKSDLLPPSVRPPKPTASASEPEADAAPAALRGEIDDSRTSPAAEAGAMASRAKARVRASPSLDEAVDEHPIAEPAAAFDASEAADDAQPAPVAAAIDDTDAPTRSARVTTDVNMRAGPDNSAPVLAVVRAGSRVQVIDCEYWCEVMFAGKRGWIYKGFIAGRS